MNEYDTVFRSDINNMCRVCLRTEVLHSLLSEEIRWYQMFCYKVVNNESKVFVCSICRHQLRKCIRFAQQCQDGDFWLNQMDCRESILQPLPPTISTNFTATAIEVHYLGPENAHFDTVEYALNHFENVYNDDNDHDAGGDEGMSEDEMPLVMLCKSEAEDKVEKRRKKNLVKNQNETKIEIEVNPKLDIKQESDIFVDTCNGTKRQKSKREAKEGFSSRMVQETEQYVVIKLTKNQVLDEMKEKLNSEKYTRAPYKCEKCVKGFNFEDVLRNHMERHTEEYGEFKCDICTQFCPSMVSLRGHIKSHTTRYKCKVCGDVRLSRQHLLEHHAISHTAAAAEYTCEHCCFSTNKRTVIQRHVKTHKQSERHTCHECGALFQNIESLRVHSARHDKSRSLQCEYCSRKFIYPSLLQKHIVSVHINKEYYCVECDIRFKSPDNLKLHFKRAKKHRDASSYTHQCPQCNEKFISATTLSVHLTTIHGHPKGYSCDVCRRMYSSRESLKGHIRRVHAEKKMNCHLCEKSFTRKSILTAHLRTHTEDDTHSRSCELLDNAECAVVHKK